MRGEVVDRYRAHLMLEEVAIVAEPLATIEYSIGISAGKGGTFRFVVWKYAGGLQLLVRLSLVY
jgi:hypothetical protein